MAGATHSKTVSAAQASCPVGTQLLYKVDTDGSLPIANLDVHCYHEIRVYASHYGTDDTTRLFWVVIQVVHESSDPSELLELDRFTLEYNATASKTYSTPGIYLSFALVHGFNTPNSGRLFFAVYGNNSPTV